MLCAGTAGNVMTTTFVYIMDASDAYIRRTGFTAITIEGSSAKTGQVQNAKFSGDEINVIEISGDQRKIYNT